MRNDFLQKNSLGEEWVRCGIQDSVHETVRQGLLLRLQCSEKCLVDNMDDNGIQKLLLLIRFGSVRVHQYIVLSVAWLDLDIA